MVMRYAICLALAFIPLTGCASSKQARNVQTSGFLHDLYPQMREGKGDEALLVYRNPNVDWTAKARYRKIMLDPVMIWRGTDSKMLGVDPKDAQTIADAFYSLLYQELAKDYEMVKEPGPETFRFQAALTDTEKSSPTLDVVSSVPAPLNVVFLASTIKTLSTGKPLFKGEASIEGKLIDAGTGEVLAAAVDRRVGGRFLDSDVFDSWNDVHAALKYWAQMTRLRMCQVRKESNCPQPQS